MRTEAEQTWRLFSAVPLNDAVRGVVADVQIALGEHNWPVRWVDPQLAHLTMRFYGATDMTLVPRLETQLAAIAAHHRPTSLVTASVGAFPTPNRPRVVWLGLEGDLAPLQQLAREVDASATVVGGQPEGKPFTAHITLGRLRDGASIGDFRSMVERLVIERVMLPIDRLQLIRSVLGQRGPSYTTVAEWRLGTPLAAAPEVREHG